MKNLVSRIEQEHAASKPHHPANDSLPVYEGAKYEKNILRLRLVQPGGDLWMFPYAALRAVYFSDGRLLTLIFGDTVILIEGQHMDTLLDKLQSDSVKSLHVYDPDRYQPSTTADTLIIETIERVAMREFLSMNED